MWPEKEFRIMDGVIVFIENNMSIFMHGMALCMKTGEWR
jgi:hypothetical protein